MPAATEFINSAQIGGVVLASTISGTIFQNGAFRNLRGGFGGDGV